MHDFLYKLYQLQNYINKQNIQNELLLILFNHYINSYPDDKWLKIQNNYFNYLPFQDPQLSIIYTILSYNLGMNLLNNEDQFIYDLIKTINSYPIETLNIVKQAQIFLEPEILKIIKNGYTNHYLKPQHFFKIAYEDFNLNNISYKEKKSIEKDFTEFLQTHQLKIFNKNYNFFNVYECLKKLINLLHIQIPNNEIELLPLFHTIQSTTIKKQIEQDFKHIEEIDKPLKEKIYDCITIIQHFKYELPTEKESII